MKITQEAFTILPDAAERRVSVLMAGFRLTLDADEARQIAEGLSRAVVEIDAANTRPAVPDITAMVGGRDDDEDNDNAPVSLMITQAQRAALRQKGYSADAIRNMKPSEAHRVLGVASKAN